MKKNSGGIEYECVWLCRSVTGGIPVDFPRRESAAEGPDNGHMRAENWSTGREHQGESIRDMSGTRKW